MSVVGSAQESADSPMLTWGLEGITATRTFLVEVDDYDDDGFVAISASGIPRRYQPYFFGNTLHRYLRCTEVSAERLAPNAKAWKVTAQYETPPIAVSGSASGAQYPSFEGDAEAEFSNPLIQPAEISTATEVRQLPIYRIFNKDTDAIEPCMNSAGQIFDPPPMRDHTLLRITITRNEALQTNIQAVQALYHNAVNSDPWFGYSAGTCKMEGITVQRQTHVFDSGIIFAWLRITYNVLFRAEGWDIALLDQGDYHWEDNGDGNDVKVFFKSVDGHPIKGLLNGIRHNPRQQGDGYKLGDGEDPIFLTIRPYARLSFGALRLVDSWADVK